MRHDNTVTWLAYWKDPVNDSQYKYVWLAANSSFKSDSDLAKYEKARKLKDYIGPIRSATLVYVSPRWRSLPTCVVLVARAHTAEAARVRSTESAWQHALCG